MVSKFFLRPSMMGTTDESFNLSIYVYKKIQSCRCDDVKSKFLFKVFLIFFTFHALTSLRLFFRLHDAFQCLWASSDGGQLRLEISFVLHDRTPWVTWHRVALFALVPGHDEKKITFFLSFFGECSRQTAGTGSTISPNRSLSGASGKPRVGDMCLCWTVQRTIWHVETWVSVTQHGLLIWVLRI